MKSCLLAKGAFELRDDVRGRIGPKCAKLSALLPNSNFFSGRLPFLHLTFANNIPELLGHMPGNAVVDTADLPSSLVRASLRH